MLLDCRDLSKHFVPIDASELRVVIVNSMVKHELTGGEYASGRQQCEEGVRVFPEGQPDGQAPARRDAGSSSRGRGQAAAT